MRHRKKKGILDRNKSARLALLRALASHLITYEKIKTTEAKGKILKQYIERLITVAKNNNLNSRRIIKKLLYKESQINKLLTEIAPRFINRKGGYVRINKLGNRKGDYAPLIQIEILSRNEKNK